MVMENPCNPCNPWSKFFAAGEQSRLLQCREKMLGKVSLSALLQPKLFASCEESWRQP